MDVNMPILISYAVGVTASLILSMYFLYDYARRRFRSSLAWGIGLFLYSVGEATDIFVDVSGEVALGKAGLFGALLVVAWGMTFLYYGTALLFFEERSFFREKMAAIIFAIYVVYSGYLVAVLPVEGFRQAVVTPIQLGLMTPIFAAAAVLFYSISRKMEKDDPARKSALLVSAAWGLLVVNSVSRGLFLEYSALTDAVIQGLHIVAWVLILYGMTMGKAAQT